MGEEAAIYIYQVCIYLAEGRTSLSPTTQEKYSGNAIRTIHDIRLGMVQPLRTLPSRRLGTAETRGATLAVL